MNIVYAVKIFAALMIVMAVTRAVIGPGLKQVLSAGDWKAVWIGITGTLVVSCFSITPMLFFATFSIWVVIYAKLIDKTGEGRLPAYALLSCVAPPFLAQLEHVGPLNDLLLLTPFRILSLFLLLPEAMRLMARKRTAKVPGWLLVCDLAVYGYALYWLLHLYGTGSLSGLVRVAFGQALDTVLPYYVMSRACANGDVRRRFLGFILAGVGYQAMVGMAETASRHYLYSQLQWLYGVSFGQATNLMRGNWLRATAAFPGPLAFGVLLLFGVGVWIALKPQMKSRPYQLILASFIGAILGTFGRGPLLGLVVIVGSLLLMRYVSGKKFLLIAVVASIAAGAAWSAGLGDLVIGLLGQVPGSDATADFNVQYRQELITTSMALLHQSPWWGVPNYLQQMQSLRQGEGIIDLVNTYLVVALNVGLFGLVLYLLPFMITLWRGADGNNGHIPVAVRREGFAWTALTVAILAVIFTVSPISIIQPIILWTATIAMGRLLEFGLERNNLPVVQTVAA